MFFFPNVFIVFIVFIFKTRSNKYRFYITILDLLFLLEKISITEGKT